MTVKEKVLSPTGDFAGVTLKRSPTGGLTVDVSDLGDIDVTVSFSHGDVKLKAPVAEQTHEAGITASSVDKRALCIGDVLGTDFDLPQGLERLNGWLVYNIKDDGVPQVLEPEESVKNDYVNKYRADYHVFELQKQGHKRARLWTEADGTAIFNNVVKGGHNEKAKLDVTGCYPNGSYWESIEYKDPLNRLAMVCYPANNDRDCKHKELSARIRAVQDVPELTISL